MEGIDYGRALGLPLRAAMTETALNRDEVEELRACSPAGVGGDDFAVRPLVRSGFADEGMEVTDAVMVPELTITADGAHWHPVGGDLGSEPGPARRAAATVSLAEAKRAVVERFLELRQADGSLPAGLPVRRMRGSGRRPHRHRHLPAAGLRGRRPRATSTTRYGDALVTEGRMGGADVLHVSRHGEGHKRLSNQVQHRANIAALKELGADCVIGRDRVRRGRPERRRSGR